MMLILTRRINESIVIGDNVKITVLGVKGSQVRLGVEAPKSVSVHREEIYERIQHEKQEDLSNISEGSISINLDEPSNDGIDRKDKNNDV